ncbi:Enamine deaminase RidA, house cleaning of reactive enamine intermediates, YjgF/YER057c/UK114 family [Rathayibacter oskolensis]|uniref:Enamine deaminase RidA, house cleaning of reactive enamine intermediates, YjgF/YER057c/UK114 family n=1 Tax=Rathayibacter oskolensis TaxID=1891671 RepID=A0A1X7PHR0_9MICO|nr:Rid family hydrolase [Rathayibacter oskolensis]SMH51085.1 Enamine deaminase RidA, house cleaning of reactive enamine intermediates, YjgF/YER057c/UK114 family [Rathayibacter oskolensis]
MTVSTLSPEGMFQPVPYDHVSIATGSRHVHVAGQISRDGEGNRLAPDDLVGQIVQVFRNTARGLAAAGATFDDVVRLRFFLTRSTPGMFDDFTAGIELAAKEVGLPTPLPPLSAIGVDFLFEPDVLVELEAYAVLD